MTEASQLVLTSGFWTSWVPEHHHEATGLKWPPQIQISVQQSRSGCGGRGASITEDQLTDTQQLLSGPCKPELLRSSDGSEGSSSSTLLLPGGPDLKQITWFLLCADPEAIILEDQSPS